MKTLPHNKLGTRRSQAGAALILVLACLIIVSALTVGFLMSMRTKEVLSKSGADTTNVKMLSETAVNIAISQVRDATKYAGLNSMAWASQPGLIRLYNNSGNANGYYKLYSAGNMVVTTAATKFDPFSTENTIPSGWENNSALYTDLNAPVASIVPGSATPVNVFPILNLAVANATVTAQNGFSINAATAPTTSNSTLVPMPVQWLYVLKDGSLYTPTTSSGTKAVISQATSTNPIVGRIAFWADDETCKVNINTASDGTFWSTPRFNTTGERQLAMYQPAKGEYQSYPGHPATVSLRKVFPGLSSADVFSLIPRISAGGSNGGSQGVLTAQKIATDTDRLYATVDEMLMGNSTASANRTTNSNITANMTIAGRFFLTANSRAPELNLYGLPRIVTWPISGNNTTNYRTVEDRGLAFCGTLGNSTSSTAFYFTRQNNFDSANATTTSDIALPRNVALLNYLDTLTGTTIPGFGGTIRAKYGQPETRQILTEIYDYIRCTNLLDVHTPGTSITLDPVSGNENGGYYPYCFGISTNSGYPKGVWDHLSGFGLGQAAPSVYANWPGGPTTKGFGGRFPLITGVHVHLVALGQGQSGNGTLGGNASISYCPPIPVYGNGTAQNNAPPLAEATWSTGFNQRGNRTWTDPYDDTNPGNATLTKITADLAHGNITYNPATPNPYNYIGNNIPPDNTTAVQAYVYVSMLCPGEGIENWSAGQWVGIQGLDKLQLAGQNLNLPASANATFMTNFMGGGGVAGARINVFSVRCLCIGNTNIKALAQDADTLPGFDSIHFKFPFYSDMVAIPSAGTPANPTGTTVLTANGNSITVNLYAEQPYPSTSKVPGALVTTATILFPDATFPTPRIPGVNGNQTNAMAATIPNTGNQASRRLVGTVQSGNATNTPMDRWCQNTTFFNDNADVFRSITLTDGDVRQLIGPAPTPLQTPFYSKTPLYTSAATFSDFAWNSCNFLPTGMLIANAAYSFWIWPYVSNGINGVCTSNGTTPGDWDNGTAQVPDGPFINMPDSGSVNPSNTGTGNIAYYDNSNQTAAQNSNLFSPNRIMPGPGMFGSLPTGVIRRLPWQTLLFRPGPQGHPGLKDMPAAGAPPDHLFLDLFWMPIVSPYAISEPFSTAGKINMNYQIIPFTYITRSTALQAAMACEQVAMISKANAGSYKGANSVSTWLTDPPVPTLKDPSLPLSADNPQAARYPLNLSESNGTLRQFREKFYTAGEIFKSASEICDIYLVPTGQAWTTDAGAKTAWYSDSFAMVGDNTRERPYAHLYNKLTTKSNTYTVYYRAEVLKMSRDRELADATTFDTAPGGGGKIMAAQRGSALFERYLDPTDSSYNAAGNDPAAVGAASLEAKYRARIINSTVFAP